MQGGDISNEAPPRIIVVANELLLRWPEGVWVATYNRQFGRWRKLADRFIIDPQARAEMHDLTWRRSMRVDVVIIGFPDAFAERIHERFDRMNLAVANVYAVENEQALVQMLAYMPEVLYVVHDNPEWTYTFGSKAVRGFRNIR